MDHDGTEQSVLEKVYSEQGNAQFMSKEMPMVPDWVYSKRGK